MPAASKHISSTIDRAPIIFFLPTDKHVSQLINIDPLPCFRFPGKQKLLGAVHRFRLGANLSLGQFVSSLVNEEKTD